MDAALASLILVIPVLAIAVAYKWWVYRSRSPATSTRRSNLLGYVLLALFALGLVGSLCQSFARTKLFCSLFGFSSVRFLNESGGDLKDVKIALRSSNGFTHRTYGWDIFPSRHAERFDMHTQHLIIESVTGRFGTNQFNYTGSVPAGQIVTFRVDPSGKLSTTNQ